MKTAPTTLPLFALCGLLAAACGLGQRPAVVRASGPQVGDGFFEKQIRPLLHDRCFGCHAEKAQQGGLRLDSLDALRKGGGRGPAVVPGRPTESLLIRAVRRAGDLKMPPDKALAADEIAALEKWIAAGAVWPDAAVPQAGSQRPGSAHWAFRPVTTPHIPLVRNPAWVRTPVDRFVLARLDTKGLKPAPPAGRRTLIRRLTYDLTGLPPSPAEVEAFERDTAPNAYEHVVDRLLASPRYGEQWGRHWLDVVRYADTAGENTDHPLPHAWRYRNWVIDAFNANMPYDRFLKLQIAGDLIAKEGPPGEYASGVIATGYLAIARRFGHDIDKDVHLTYEDTIDTLGKSMLGLTLGCARCHDHKFDPISTRDYYGLYGIFASTRFSFPGCEPQQQPRDLVPLISPADYERTVRPIQEEAARLDAESKKLGSELPESGRKLALQLAAGKRILSSGSIPDGGANSLTPQESNGSRQIAVKRGDVIQLSVSPLGNHGADSTRVELEIAEVGGDRRQWSTSDLIQDLTAANPHPVHDGAAWCFLDAQDGLLFLPERVTSIDGRTELQAWRNSDTPSVFVNRSDQQVKVWTTLPARSFFVHPGPKGPVAIAWLSPIDGEVTISGRIADAHPGGPDGVGWLLEQFRTPVGARAADCYLALSYQGRDVQALRQRRSDLLAKIPNDVAYAVSEGEPRDARLQRRGNPEDLGDAVPRKFLDILGGQRLAAPAYSGRRELAEWIASPTNPLTARVFANRIWQGHFGKGLVATPNDFGTRGAPPSDQSLLDYLAHSFVKSGWNVKALHRMIVLSATYRQANAGAPAGGLFVGFARRRLTAEELRDTLLSVSGELDLEPGRGHPFPPDSGWSFTQHAPFAAEYDTMKRSVYVMQKRNRRARFFALFDGADPNASTPVRDVTIVPTQALYFMNDPFVHARAEKLGQRIVAAGAYDSGRIDLACRILFGRPAAREDWVLANEFMRGFKVTHPGIAPDQATIQAWTAYARVLLAGNEFLYVD